MSTFQDKRREDELLKVAEQAAEWSIILEEEPSPAQRTAFARWLEESPLHVEMFLRATAVNRLGVTLDPAVRQQLEAARLKLEGTECNVYPLESAAQTSQTSRDAVRTATRPRRRWISRLSLAAAVAATAAGLWWFVPELLGRQHYGTGVGEQRSVTLKDGSVIYLNADSQVAVHYDSAARDVDLMAGEAMFKVAHDSRRPFRVHVDDAVVQAVGTQFDVYRKPTQTTIAVVEGVVQVSRTAERLPSNPSASGALANAIATGPSAPERLIAGEAVKLAAGHPIEKPVRISIAQVTAWRQRRLIFEWDTLETIAAEFNRYNRAQIRIEGSNARQRRYTAVFDANEPQTLINFLAKDGGLVFSQQGNDLVIRERQSPGTVASQELSVRSQ